MPSSIAYRRSSSRWCPCEAVHDYERRRIFADRPYFLQDSVVSRAETVSGEFFDAFNKKLATRRRSALPVVAQADFRFLMSLFNDSAEKSDINLGSKAAQLRIIREAIGGYTA